VGGALLTGGFDSGSDPGDILFALQQLHVRGGRLTAGVRLSFDSAPVDVALRRNRLFVTTLGGPPGGAARIEAVAWPLIARGVRTKLIELPHRIAASMFFAAQGRPRILASAFGFNVGGLFEYEYSVTADGAYAVKKPRTLIDHAGPLVVRKVELGAGQGSRFVALTAQARERLYSFARRYPQATGSPRVLLEQEPGFGYTDLDTADLDGRPGQEIVLTNGDNGDFVGAPPRPHNGVRIYSVE